MIEQLKSILKPAREIAGELARLTNMEAEARRVIKSASEAGDIDSPQVTRKVGDAHIRLSLARGRRGHVEAESGRLDDALREACRKEARRWNGLVAEAKEALRESRIQANLIFWDGDERACRRYYDSHLMEDAPAFHKFSRAFCPETPVHADAIKDAEMLAAHIARHGRALGWTEEQIVREPIQAPSRARRQEEPPEVKVRAIEDLPTVIAEQLRSRDPKRPRQAPRVEAGEEVTLPIAQYRAWARFFERVK
jgi:hypothetical protein